jgi:diguanylate cyclase (GGDEF)-like protein
VRPALCLNALMIKGCLKQFGLWPVLAGVTLVSIVVSVAITLLAHHISGEPMPSLAWAICIACPLVLAPTMSLGSFSLLIKLDRAHEQLRLISDTDDLTGAHNRRYFMDRLRAEVERSARSGFTFSLALIDVDNFKAINDQHGHLAGDEVLRCLAQTCMAQVRSTDTFARFGGEEFAVLLPQTDTEHARQWLDRLRQHVAQLHVELPGARLGATVSIGLATTGKPAQSPAIEINAVLRVADEALYRAKRAGKNQVAGPLAVPA